MNVSQIMTRVVVTCAPSDSMDRAAQIMWNRDCGCVPIVDAGGVLHGMLTDRDMAMAAYTKGRTLESMRIADAMCTDVQACRASDDVEVVLATMAEKQIHRIPVVDEMRQLIGIVSLADVLQAVAREGNSLRKRLGEPLLDALISVTRPRVAAEPSRDGAAGRSSAASVLTPAAPPAPQGRAGAAPAGASAPVSAASATPAREAKPAKGAPAKGAPPKGNPPKPKR